MRAQPAALALLLLVGGCDPVEEILQAVCEEQVPDSVTATTWAGIEGEVYRDGSCGTSWCVVGGEGRLVILAAGTQTVITDVYFRSTFRVALAPGTYDVVIAFAGAHADRSATGLTVGSGAGFKIVRSYSEDYDARLLSLFFDPGAAGQKGTVLAGLGVTEVALSVPPASFPEVRVRLPYEGHPELTGERALATYPGVVVGYALDPICSGAGGWVEAGGTHHSVWDWD
jgi:hypothetical protein